MNSPATRYDLQRIRNEVFVRAIDFHWELDSTNSEACRQLEEGPVTTPRLVLAERQTGGRGRGRNRWWSAQGSITCSLIVPLEAVAGERLPHIAVTAGLAICQAIEAFAPQADLGIKWPNDVYLQQRKLAGILIELPPQRPHQAVIGMGINVNNTFDDAPHELTLTGISLCDALQMQLDRTELLIAILKEFERRWKQLQTGSAQLVDQWSAYHILQDRAVEVDAYGGLVKGICRGIDRDGALLVETSSGTQRCLAGVVVAFDAR